MVTVDELSFKPKLDQLGPLKSGSITLTGFLRHIYLKFREYGGPVELGVYDDVANEKLRDIGISQDDDLAALFRVELVYRPEVLESDCFVLCMTIKQNWHRPRTQPEIAGLLLERTETHGVYTRIGTLDLFDQYALKMRYKTPPEIEPEVDQTYWPEERPDVDD